MSERPHDVPTSTLAYATGATRPQPGAGLGVTSVALGGVAWACVGVTTVLLATRPPSPRWEYSLNVILAMPVILLTVLLVPTGLGFALADWFRRGRRARAAALGAVLSLGIVGFVAALLLSLS